MDEPVVVVDANEEECLKLCAKLEEGRYRATPIYFLPDLEKYLQANTCLVVILDLNTEFIDNRVVRELTTKNPGVYFLGLTKHRFNPELEESICYHVYACLTKPVDPDELFFWLKSICEDEADSGNDLKA